MEPTSQEPAMQRADLVLCRHLAALRRPVTIAATGVVPAWMRQLPQFAGVIDLADAVACSNLEPGVVVIADALPALDRCVASIAALRSAGHQIVVRHGAGWRLQPQVPPSRPNRLREWLVHRLPRVAAQLGVMGLRPPFRHDGGQAWWASLRGLRLPAPGSPRCAVLFENGRPLPFPDSVHDEIRQHGGGRYSVWNDGVYFAASDGSDPASNGRRYEMRVVQKGAEGEWVPQACDEQTFAQHFVQVAEQRSSQAPAGRRILILISSLGPGGAERQFAYLAKGLVQRGHEVAILSLDGFAGVAGHYLPMLADSGVQLLDGLHAHAGLGPALLFGGAAPDSTGLLDEVPELFAADVWRIASHLAVFRPDVLHCALDKPNLLGAIAGTCLAVPRIVLSMRNMNPSHLPYLDQPWYRRWYKLAASVPGLLLSANSRAGGEDYAQWLGLPAERVHVVPNGLDPTAIRVAAAEELSALRDELQIRAGVPVLVGVFRLSAEKRPMLWLATVQRLRRQFPDLVAIHVGLGAMTEAVRARVLELGLGDCVRLLGRRQDTEVVLRAADVLLLCSEFEGIPNVILEAQWLERPVVCTAAGGNAEVVQHGRTGLVVEERAAGELEAALAEACASLLADRARQASMGQAGRERVETVFATDRMIEASRRLYSI